jgi:hypothetical protein
MSASPREKWAEFVRRPECVLAVILTLAAVYLHILVLTHAGALWRDEVDALHEPERRWQWLVAASTAYGLAVGARPTLLFGGVILLVPMVQARRERQRIWPALTAATVPMVLIGVGLMLYNGLRFDNP